MPTTPSNRPRRTFKVEAKSTTQLRRSVSSSSSSSVGTPTSSANGFRGVWTTEEHERFIEAIKYFSSGPWKDIAAHVGSRTARQTMTHAQKYRQKIARRLRAVRASCSQSYSYELGKRFSALLSHEEQIGDSILSTSLAIVAEKELDNYSTSEGYSSPVSHGQVEIHSPYPTQLTPTSSNQDSVYSVGGTAASNEADYEECMDFLIETMFHSSAYLANLELAV